MAVTDEESSTFNFNPSSISLPPGLKTRKKILKIGPIFVGSVYSLAIEIINNKVRHNMIDAKCRWRSDRLDGAESFWEPLGQTQVMQSCQRETPSHQGAIIH